MSKNKTKRARRAAKREDARKLAVQHRKAAAAKPSSSSSRPPPSKKRKPDHSPSAPSLSTKPTLAPQQSQKQQRETLFGPYDHILLVGEGDFSFTRALVLSHGCAHVTATSYDSAAETHRKYPQYADIERELCALSPPVPIHHGIDAGKLAGYKSLRRRPADDDDDDDDDDWQEEDDDEEEGVGGGEVRGRRRGRGRARGGIYDTVVFNFPHVGGLSTDVNRQVRANQALLVSFFTACLSRPDFLKPGGRIVVSLFEGAPYTLWNVRDLARHCGLRVKESRRFVWADYPGYAHVRTLGRLEGGGGWKGEDREARMYVFEKADVDAGGGGDRAVVGGKRVEMRRKRGREESGSEGED